MDNQQTILFISNGFYFLYENNSSKNEIEKGQLEDLKSIANENAIAYIDGEPYVVAIQSSKRKGFDDVFSEYMSSWSNMATPIAPVVKSFKNLKSSHQPEAEVRLYQPQ